MADDDGDFSVSEYPRATVSGRFNYVFHCSVPNCPFYCRNKIPYDRHISAEHFCNLCQRYCVDIRGHVCRSREENNQVGDGGGVEAPLAENVVITSISSETAAAATTPERTTTPQQQRRRL
ncbi:unnamed protein product [Allacma fusca]|uniref:Uncharacterized protein n=1 Tax=Allacma fusca TaxID=39272 RepID=A0A8J2NVL3_9HEXA|nr:unnamed protein product [Allacma fusca]